MKQKQCKISGRVSQLGLLDLLALVPVSLRGIAIVLYVCVCASLSGSELLLLHLTSVHCTNWAVNMITMEICVGLQTHWQDLNESK